MSKLRLFFSTLLMASVSSTAFAGSLKNDLSNIDLNGQAIKLEINVGEDLKYRANHLPQKLSARGRMTSLNDGFSGNGFYGDKDISRLSSRLKSSLERSLSSKNIDIEKAAPYTVKVTLVDARPNRPTFKQLSKNPSLSRKSFSTGGAAFEIQVTDASGVIIGEADYDWYDMDISDAIYDGTWSDAKFAINRLSRSLGKILAGN